MLGGAVEAFERYEFVITVNFIYRAAKLTVKCFLDIKKKSNKGVYYGSAIYLFVCIPVPLAKKVMTIVNFSFSGKPLTPVMSKPCSIRDSRE